MRVVLAYVPEEVDGTVLYMLAVHQTYGWEHYRNSEYVETFVEYWRWKMEEVLVLCYSLGREWRSLGGRCQPLR